VDCIAGFEQKLGHTPHVGTFTGALEAMDQDGIRKRRPVRRLDLNENAHSGLRGKELPADRETDGIETGPQENGRKRSQMRIPEQGSKSLQTAILAGLRVTRREHGFL
jgi:hypothetical protein